MNIVKRDFQIIKKMRKEISDSQDLVDLGKATRDKTRQIWNEGRIAGLDHAIRLLEEARK